MFTTRFKRKADGIDFIYEHFRHEEFIQHALIITTDADRKVKRLYFNSFELGTLHVGRDGSITCHRWETEDEAQNASRNSRHFTTISGVQSDDRALADAIIRNVMQFVKEPIVNRYVRAFYDSPGTEVQIPTDYQPAESRRDAENPAGILPPPEPRAPKKKEPQQRAPVKAESALWKQSDYREDSPNGGWRNPDLMFLWMLLAMSLLLAIGFC